MVLPPVAEWCVCGGWVNKGFTGAFTGGGDKESKALTRVFLGECFALSAYCQTLLHALDKSFTFTFTFNFIVLLLLLLF